MEQSHKDYIAGHYLIQSDSEIAEHLGLKTKQVHDYRDRVGLKKETRIIQKMQNEKKAKAKDKEQRDIIDHLISERDNLQERLELSTAIQKGIKPHKVVPTKGVKDESVAFVIASDWHYEEIVTKKSTNGLNEFNLSIADQRINAFFANTVKLLKKEQSFTTINTLVLALLGDFITNWNLHEDTPKHCALGVSDALTAVENHLISGIQYILDNTKVDIIIPTSVGNHSRVTKKIHITTEEQDSVETLLYAHIARYFDKEKRVTVHLPESYLSYLTLWDTFTVCFHHGHAINYGGGIGGLTIPMLKGIAGWDRNRRADLYICGHFHQQLDGNKFMVNGSLIGYNAYALRIKASAEPASQWFFLVSRSSNRKTITAPIFL